MKLTLRLLFIAVLLSNCKAIMMKAYKIKSPEIENKLTILKSATVTHLKKGTAGNSGFCASAA